MDDGEVLEKLFVISNIQEGETYSYTSNKNMTHNSYMTSMYRSYYGENRDVMFEKIEEIFINGVELYKKDESNRDILLLIKGGLKGINNIIITYKKDSKLKEKFKSLIINILALIYEDDEIETKHMKNTFKNNILSKWSKQEISEMIGKGINNQVKHHAIIYAGFCLQKAVMSVFLF